MTGMLIELAFFLALAVSFSAVVRDEWNSFADDSPSKDRVFLVASGVVVIGSILKVLNILLNLWRT